MNPVAITQHLNRRLPKLVFGCVLAALLTPTTTAQAQSWNINFAGRNETGEYILVADDTDPIGMGGGAWSNVMSPTSSSTWDPDSPLTIVEANGGSSIGLDWGPNGSLRDHDGDTGGPALTPLNQGWFGYWDNFDQTLNFTNIPTGTYDVTVYFTWRWNENSVDYQITQGTGSDLGPKTIYPEQSTASSYADYVEGSNYVIFQDVSPADGDLDLHIFNTEDGGISAIQISTPLPTLTAVVNTVTGITVLKNLAADPVSLDYYLIESAAGTLDASSWNSLDDQEADAPGLGWVEAGGSSDAQLAELNLSDSITLAPNESLSLGEAFDYSVLGPGVDGDLTFRYGIPGNAGLRYGDVVYVTDPSLIGDLDLDGFVGITDLNLVLSSWNDTVSPGDSADPSGDQFIGIEDLNVVLGNWNAGTPPAAAVPEPASMLMLLLGAGVSLRRRQ